MKLTDYSLSDIGFTQKEANIYSTLLELGEGTVFDISKRSKLNRTTIYPILYKLLQEGVVKKVTKSKKRYFFVEDVRDLKKNITQKERILDTLLPQLEALHNIIPNKPKITYYEGAGRIQDFYLHIFDSLSAGDTIYDFIGDVKMNDALAKHFVTVDYAKERIKRKIQIKVLATPSAIAQEWVDSAHESLREIRIVKSGIPFSTDLEIYKNGIGIISYTDDFMGVIIESKELSLMFQAAYDLMWKGSDIK